MDAELIKTCAWTAAWIFIVYLCARDLVKSFRSFWTSNMTVQVLKERYGVFHAFTTSVMVFVLIVPAFCYYVVHTMLALHKKHQVVLAKYKTMYPEDSERLLSIQETIMVRQQLTDAFKAFFRRPYKIHLVTDDMKDFVEMTKSMKKYMVFRMEADAAHKRCAELGKKGAIVRIVAYLTYCDWLLERIVELDQIIKEFVE